MGGAYFPMAAGKVQKCWVQWKRASQRQGELTGPHHPTSSRGSAEVSCPSSKQDQQQPQLHPGICVFPVPKPESALQAGWTQSRTRGVCPSASPLILIFPVYGTGKNAESQVSDLEGARCLLG